MKVVLQHLIHFFLHLLFILPVDKKKIYFVSFNGKQYSCNPKYLYEYLLKNRKNEFSYVWEFQDTGKAALVPDAKVVKRLSFASVIQMMTAGYIVTNSDFKWYIPLRKNQFLLETWHGGGAYKRVGFDVDYSKSEMLAQSRSSRKVSLYLSSSAKFTNVQSKAKGVPDTVFFPSGLPRNDLFFHDTQDLILHVKNSLKVQEDCHLVLYAPTHRIANDGTYHSVFESSGDFSVEQILSTLIKKFGGAWKFLYRGHYFEKQFCNGDNNWIDVSLYEDMQKLLAASDVLITDYSSCMWDFALTNKPGFLYVPDLQEYENNRNFYTPPSSWAYPIAVSCKSLCENIMRYEYESSVAKINKHLKELGSYEKGTACEQVVNIVFADK